MKSKKIIILSLLFFIASSTYSLATNSKIIDKQKEKLGISVFINESKKYTQDAYSDLNMNEIFKSAISGKIDNKTIIKKIINLFGKEVKEAIKILGSIAVIIVIHSILKSINEGLDNKGIIQITYYVQYILIVTLIMGNFASIINNIREAIQDLVRLFKFSNSNTYNINCSNRLYNFSKCYRTNTFIHGNIYRKYNRKNIYTNSFIKYCS